MTKYSCNSCSKKFHYKEFYDNHRIACEFFSQSRKQLICHQESNEKLPLQEEMFKLLQHLTLKCEALTDEVDKLKKCAFISNKKTCESLLDKLKPSITFTEWVESIVVENDCITETFNHKLTDGIIKCIHNKIEENNSEQVVVPIRAFKAKPGVLFIFEKNEENKFEWTAFSNEKLGSMIEIIRHEIGKFYCIWKENQRSIDMDTEMLYLMKISGLKVNKNKQFQDVKSWIISHYSK